MKISLEQIKAQPPLVKVGLLVICLLIFLMLCRIWSEIQLRFRTHEEAVPVVNVIRAQNSRAPEKMTLPGTLDAWHEAPIYARTDGYVKTWLVDIGSVVQKGQVLAIIETPELDAQLRQAEAEVKVRTADDSIAQVTAKRWVQLLKSHAVSKQETDEKVSQAQATQAALSAAVANRDRLQELVGFEQVISPFDGVISMRATDIGRLINSGSRPAEANPLFQVVQHNPLRLYVKIPETYAANIRPHMHVKLTVAEHPGVFFDAVLYKTAEAIDAKTRTLLAQFTVKNDSGQLLPGNYTQVYFEIPTPLTTVRLPVNTLLFRAEGLQVATVNAEGLVVLKPVHISRDEGEVVEIADGIKPNEAIIVNPSDSIFENQKVRVVAVNVKNPVLGTS